MQFLTHFIVFFLIFWWFMLIIYKVNAPQKLYNRFKYTFIDKLTSCEFCMESHIACLLAIPLVFYYQDPKLLLCGIMSASLSNILKK